MYRIGEFSKITSLTIKTLRYYDDIELLKPAAVDEQNSYRLYDESSYEKALIIKTLKDFEFTIQEMLESVPGIQDGTDLAAFLMEKHEQLALRVASAKSLQRQIQVKVETLKEVHTMKTDYRIEIKDLPDIQIAYLAYKGKYQDVGNYVGQLFKAVGGNATGVIGALYFDESYMEDGATIEVFIPVKKVVEKGDVHTKVLKGQRCLSILHMGPYDLLSNAYKAAMDYMTDHDLKGTIPNRELYLKGPGMLLKGNPAKYETEIIIPLV
jgi:effector-binding domain-containing protein